MIKFYDTCSLIEGYSGLDENIWISSVSLDELEEIKGSRTKSNEVKFRARKAVRNIERNGVGVVLIEDVLAWYTGESINRKELCGLVDGYLNDDLIIISALYMQEEGGEDVVFYSEDLLCRMRAENIYGLRVASLGNEERCDVYKGYKVIEGSSDEINKFVEESKFEVNEYLIMHNTDDGKWSEMRYNGETLVGLKLPPSGFIKEKNSLQRCLLDALYNKDIGIVVAMGPPGCGKTFLGAQMGVYMSKDKGWYDKIVGVREYSSDGNEVGYLKGDLEDKLGWTYGSIVDNLSGGEYEYESLVKQGKLINTVPYFIKGRTFDNAYMIVDEAEDMSSHLLKLCGTRVAGDCCKVVCCGDYKQSNIDNSTSNPLMEMCKYFKGSKKFACVMLDEDVRSEVSRLFAEAEF